MFTRRKTPTTMLLQQESERLALQESNLQAELRIRDLQAKLKAPALWMPYPARRGADAQQQLSRTGGAQHILTMVMLFGLGSITAYASQFWTNPDPPHALASAATGIMVAGGSLIVGALVGALFGIPRARPQDLTLTATPEGRHYQPNTNLEQVSDWLTKILVGVGLTQIATIPGRLMDLADAVGPALGSSNTPATASRIFALGEILLFSVSGFLYSFLWTRLILISRLEFADDESAAADHVAATPVSPGPNGTAPVAESAPLVRIDG